jgi:hypothetical protein
MGMPLMPSRQVGYKPNHHAYVAGAVVNAFTMAARL